LILFSDVHPDRCRREAPPRRRSYRPITRSVRAAREDAAGSQRPAGGRSWTRTRARLPALERLEATQRDPRHGRRA
jgi:hypothetical protein